MTDKELKKLSRLELLELLLIETHENERLKEELEKAKKENSIEKSAQLLNETAKQLDETLQKASTLSDNVSSGEIKTTATQNKFPSNKKSKNIFNRLLKR